MLGSYFAAMGIILVVLSTWIGVQHLARWYAKLHPEFGPAKEEGSGCGFGCRCVGNTGDECQRKELETDDRIEGTHES